MGKFDNTAGKFGNKHKPSKLLQKACKFIETEMDMYVDNNIYRQWSSA